jgi:hypothetical protein
LETFADYGWIDYAGTSADHAKQNNEIKRKRNKIGKRIMGPQ